MYNHEVSAVEPGSEFEPNVSLLSVVASDVEDLAVRVDSVEDEAITTVSVL